MSKLLTDLMEAERRRRQFAIGRSGKDAPAKAGDAAFDADEALRARIEAEHLAAAEADPWKRVALDRKASGAYPLAAEKDAEPATVPRLEAEQKAAEAAERRAREASELAAAARSATARPEVAAETASSQRGPQQTWRRLFAATALALMAGIGTGFWLGKPPTVPVGPWPEDPGVLRLRLDDRLMNPPRQEPRTIPRDRAR